MGAPKGRTKRAPLAPHEKAVLHGTIHTDAVAKAHRAAEALNVTMAMYLEQLLFQDQLDENGRPLWWPAEDPRDQAVLPVTA